MKAKWEGGRAYGAAAPGSVLAAIAWLEEASKLLKITAAVQKAINTLSQKK